MKFSSEEIQLAHELKEAGLSWEPQPGYYVWDRDSLIEHDSPFHGRVFFILELKHFLRRAENMEHLQSSLVWLPTWQQIRELLLQRGRSHEEMQARLIESGAFLQGTERLELYRLLRESIGG
ncbi:hypothetical protein LOC71_17995 [Rhodopirellula sp. JC740]|uniref:Uncharacterized protein n=1 Tax=Rhodopirellula halodulae TaxID=2894198 RepID=A0ABS8NKW3_9BACT|nr:hypothetical protein [Rhodopirellula sp. JC740]